MITHRTNLLQAIAAGGVCALLFFEGPLAKGDWTSFRNGGASHSTSKLPMQWSAAEGISAHCQYRAQGAILRTRSQQIDGLDRMEIRTTIVVVLVVTYRSDTCWTQSFMVP